MRAGPDRHRDISWRLRLAAMVLRAIFLGILAAMVARVSLPQSETIWTAYENPDDAVRLVLGILACVWIVLHAFMTPEDPQGYRTWLFLGIGAQVRAGVRCFRCRSDCLPRVLLIRAHLPPAHGLHRIRNHWR